MSEKEIEEKLPKASSPVVVASPEKKTPEQKPRKTPELLKKKEGEKKLKAPSPPPLPPKEVPHKEKIRKKRKMIVPKVEKLIETPPPSPLQKGTREKEVREDQDIPESEKERSAETPQSKEQVPSPDKMARKSPDIEEQKQETPPVPTVPERDDEQQVKKIEVQHVDTYNFPDSTPSKLQLDEINNEIFVATSGNIAIINEDGMPIYSIVIEKPLAAICVNKEGDIYISYGKNDIHILNYRGNYKGKLDLSSVPDSASIIVQSLHIDNNANFYIGDRGVVRVIVLDASGNFLYQLGKKGKGDGEFLNVKAITTDAENVYILNPALYRVSVFEKGGKFLYSFGKVSSLLGGFSMLAGIDAEGGKLFVVDSNRSMVIVFDKKGDPITEFGGVGRHPGSLSWPSDIKVGKKGMVYVADKGNNRVQVYKIIVP